MAFGHPEYPRQPGRHSPIGMAGQNRRPWRVEIDYLYLHDIALLR